MRAENPSSGAALFAPPTPQQASLEAPPVCELSLSSCMEDPSAELAVAEILAERLGRKLRVLVSVADGGAALALLSKDCVAEVHAVDLNPAQVYLIDLKRAAIETLSLEDQLILLEANDDVTKEQRQALFASLRPALSDASRDYWDRHPEQIAYGVGRVGRFEGMLFDLRRALEQAQLDPMTSPAKALGSAQWNKAFDTHFEKSRLGQSLGTAWIGYTDRDISKHFAVGIANGLRKFTAAKASNYFLQSALRGRFEEGQMPPWLDESAQERMKAIGLDRLHLHVGPFLGKMIELSDDQPFDLIVTSAQGDSLPFAEMHRLYTEARSAISEKGALLARRFTSHRPLARIVQKSFDVDAALSSTFQNSSLSFANDQLIIGFAA